MSANLETIPLCPCPAAGRLARRAKRRGCLVGAALLLLTGCSQAPAPPPALDVSPRKAANEAISLYDKDGDGCINLGEITQTPALAASWPLIDADRDGSITREEIEARVRAWRDSTVRLMKATATIYLQDEPLAGATVTLEPVAFLGQSCPTVTAVTDNRGTARFNGSDRRYPGVYVGLYTVRVSKLKDGQETIPAKYNTESELVYEVSREQWTNMIFNVYQLQADSDAGASGALGAPQADGRQSPQ